MSSINCSYQRHPEETTDGQQTSEDVSQLTEDIIKLKEENLHLKEMLVKGLHTVNSSAFL